MTLPRAWVQLLKRLSRDAAPLERHFFRSVEIRYAHPDDVLTGEGTRRYGGRFARTGVRAVYLAADEETALCEVTARKKRLSGRRQIELTDYPRVTYVVEVKLARHINLAAMASGGESGKLVSACLAPDIRDSQEVGEFLSDAEVQGILYPSATPECKGENVVVFRELPPKPSLELVNRDRVIALFEEWAKRG